MDAHDAYQWAQGILDSWRNGKAFDPNPELFRGGMGGIGTKILIAIDIDHLAMKACVRGHPCPYINRRCFMDWILPDPTIPQPWRASYHIRRIEDCMKLFEEYLRMRGYVAE